MTELTTGGRPLKIFMWAASMQDGTYIYRLRMPAEELRRLGHEVEIGQQMTPWGREEADIIVGHRVCQNLPTRMWLLLCEERHASGRGGMVYEIDDDLFNIDGRTNPLGRRFQHPQVQENLRLNLRAADAVTVSTPHLADVVRKVRRGDPAAVHVVPNAVRAETFATAKTSNRVASTLYGWQGSSTHHADWQIAREAVALVLAEDPVRLRFLGTAHLDGLPLNGRGRVDGKAWTTDIDEHYRRVAEFDVSLAPLANTPFNRSKSALRVQESLALGVPVVASDVPSYRGWVADGVTGFIVPASTRKWVAAMRELQDPAVRAAMGAAGREVARAWSIEATVGNWLAVYRSLLPGKPGLSIPAHHDKPDLSSALPPDKSGQTLPTHADGPPLVATPPPRADLPDRVHPRLPG